MVAMDYAFYQKRPHLSGQGREKGGTNATHKMIVSLVKITYCKHFSSILRSLHLEYLMDSFLQPALVLHDLRFAWVPLQYLHGVDCHITVPLSA